MPGDLHSVIMLSAHALPGLGRPWEACHAVILPASLGEMRQLALSGIDQPQPLKFAVFGSRLPRDSRRFDHHPERLPISGRGVPDDVAHAGLAQVEGGHRRHDDRPWLGNAAVPSISNCG
jgi:hypothetical protein